MSVIGGAYEKGISGIWYTFLYLPLTPIFWILAPYIRRSRFVTVADFFVLAMTNRWRGSIR